VAADADLLTRPAVLQDRPPPLQYITDGHLDGPPS